MARLRRAVPRTIGTISGSSSRPRTPRDGRPQRLHPRADGADGEGPRHAARLGGVDHWNTDNPHSTLIVRGVADDGQDLVIARDYIKEGIRDRARDSSPGSSARAPNTRSATALESADDSGALDQPRPAACRDSRSTAASSISRPRPTARPDELHALKSAALRKLETLGLADQVGPGHWALETGPRRPCASSASAATSSSACTAA